MVRCGESECPICNGKLCPYGYCKRRILGPLRKSDIIKIRKLRCRQCRKCHRELPSNVEPYKHYDKNIVDSVRNGTISDLDPEYEDYPNFQTMERWKRDDKPSKNG